MSRDKGRISCQLRWLLLLWIHICFFDMIAVEFVLSYSIAEGYNACAAISNVSFTDGYPTQQCWFPYCLIRVKLAIPKSEWLFSSRRIHGAISLGIWFQMNYHYQYQQWIVWDWAYIFCYILRKKIQIISLSLLYSVVKIGTFRNWKSFPSAEFKWGLFMPCLIYKEHKRKPKLYTNMTFSLQLKANYTEQMNNPV